MTTEIFLQFFFHNNAVLIEILVVVILLSAAFLTYRSFKLSKDEELNVHPSGDLSAMEEMLKKLLERANDLPSAGTLAQTVAAAGAGADAKAAGVEATALLEQITVLKKEIQSKQSEIETIKKAAPAGAEAAPSGVSNEEKIKLENQVKELQRKLEEFDIISADIADLSFYKEENMRLQKELGSLKGTTELTAKPPSSQPQPEFIPAAAAPAAVAAAPETVATPPPPEAAIAPGTAVQEVVDEDLIKEYAAMVDAQRAASAPAKAAPAKSENKVVDPLSGQNTSMDNVAGMPEIDIPAIGETKPAASSTGEVDLGTLDLDKMAAEALDLKEPSAAAPAAEELLNQDIDPDKLANEASEMSVDPQTKEVMGQFENFSKKEK